MTIQSRILNQVDIQWAQRYAERHPHLATLARNAETSPQAARALGEQIARLPYIDGVSGRDALVIGRIGLVCCSAWGGGTPMTSEMIQWADDRNTAREVAEAIWWLAGGNSDGAERIWQSPTAEERLAIWERVTGNGLRDARDYAWGCDTLAAAL
jgi:hypothetical protein